MRKRKRERREVDKNEKKKYFVCFDSQIEKQSK